jgi:hypothetical protein
MKGREKQASLQKKGILETKDGEMPSSFIRSISTTSRAVV